MPGQNRKSTDLVTTLSDRRKRPRRWRSRVWAAFKICAPGMIAGIIVGAIAPVPRAADRIDTGLPQLAVGPLLEVEPSVPSEFYVRVGGAADALPQHSYIRIENLPTSVTLSEGQRTGTGAWVVPLSALEGLRVTAPAGVRDGVEFVVTLVAGDGSVLVERTVGLDVTPAVVGVPAEEKENAASVPPTAATVSAVTLPR